MAYGKHYTLPFKSLANDNCRFDILEKDYIGAVLKLAGGGRSPVVHSWDAEDILTPVWGSKCVLQYLNEFKVPENFTPLFISYESVLPDWVYAVVFEGVPVAGSITVRVTADTGDGTQFIDVSVPVTYQQSYTSIGAAIVAAINANLQFTATYTAYPSSLALSVANNGLFPIFSYETTVPAADTTSTGNQKLPIETFLTTDETKFKGEMYLNNVLQFTGYMVIDDFSAPYLTPPTTPTLTFTDGLALLDQVDLDEAGYTVASGKIAISKIIEDILLLTNLKLPVSKYYNLFPEGEPNRNENPAIDPLSLQYLAIKTFLVDDNAFDNCRTVLEKILKANCSVLMQQQGRWTIVRQPEYKRFAGNIPGNENGLTPLFLTPLWQASFSDLGGSFTFENGMYLAPYFPVGSTFTISNANDARFNITYEINFSTDIDGDLRISVYQQPTDPLDVVDVEGYFAGDNIPMAGTVAQALVSKKIGKAGDLLPIERDQLKQYTRPTKKITTTFNYRIPQLLTNSNLQRLGELIGASTDGDNTLTDYELSDWTNQNTAAAFIRVVTNTLTGKEVDRYIMMPWTTSPTGGHESGIVGVPIEVNQGDRFTFSFRYRADHDENSNSIIDIGIVLETSVGRRNLIFYEQSPDSRNNNLRWVTAGVAVGTPIQITFPFKFDRAAENMTEWHTFDFMDYDYNGLGMPPIPRDGILYIFIRGFNHLGGTYPEYDTYLKDFQFEYQLFINDSIQIVGQENKSSQNIITKSETANEIFVDDAPKFNIAGGIFKKSGSAFIRTADWIKASGETDTYRHGEVNAVDKLLLNSNWRTVFEGSFYGLCHPVDSFTIDGLEGMFLPYKIELDYRQNASRLTLLEVSKASDPTFQTLLYNFRYLYK